LQARAGARFGLNHFFSRRSGPRLRYKGVKPGDTPMDLHDAELIARWRRGDAAAFAGLVRRWQQPVARFLTHLVGRTELAQDLCQEVFLRVYNARPQYCESGAFSTWLYRIALNVARDAGRRRRHEPAPLGNGEVVGPAPSPAAVCEQRELAGLVARAVAELPEPLRLVLVLRHYEGLSFEQIARLTATPASTLKSRFAAALARLRDRLRPLGDDREDPHP
jgi:RNA polymerase sigma-70 factor (ECF subfamily)